MVSSIRKSKINIHISFGSHANKSNFLHALTQFKKFGPFDIYAYEDANQKKSTYIQDTKYFIEQIREQYLFGESDIFFIHSEFSREQYSFFCNNYPINVLPLDSNLDSNLVEKFGIYTHHYHVAHNNIKTSKIENAIKNMVLAIKILADIQFKRDYAIITNILTLDDKIKQLFPNLLEKKSIKIFARIGKNHVVLLNLLNEKNKDNKINVNYSFDNPINVFSLYAKYVREVVLLKRDNKPSNHCSASCLLEAFLIEHNPNSKVSDFDIIKNNHLIQKLDYESLLFYLNSYNKYSSKKDWFDYSYAQIYAT